MTLTNVIILACLFVWLVFETIWDLCDRNIPVWFSLLMLNPGIILLAITISLWVAILMVVSIVSTEVYHRSRIAGLIGIFVPILLLAILFPVALPLVVGWGILVTLWLIKLLGGADALVGLSLLIFFPDWFMGAAILSGLLAWGVAMLIHRYGTQVGVRLWTVFQARLQGEKLPGIGAYALAALFYGLYRLF